MNHSEICRIPYENASRIRDFVISIWECSLFTPGGFKDFHICSLLFFHVPPYLYFFFFTFPIMSLVKISGSPHQSGKNIDVPPPTKKSTQHCCCCCCYRCFWFFFFFFFFYRMFPVDTCTGSHIIQSDFYSTKIIELLFRISKSLYNWSCGAAIYVGLQMYKKQDGNDVSCLFI